MPKYHIDKSITHSESLLLTNITLVVLSSKIVHCHISLECAIRSIIEFWKRRPSSTFLISGFPEIDFRGGMASVHHQPRNDKEQFYV